MEEEIKTPAEEIKRPDIEFAKLEDTIQTAKQCEKQVDEYTNWLDNLSEEELKEEEQKIIEMINEYESVLKDTVYTLHPKVQFEGRTYSKDKVFKFIQEIINKRSCNYSETLGLYQLYQYWANPGKTVSYPILDSTLRTLESTAQFKGVTEWEKILVINEYFKIDNAKMSMDYLQQIYYAHLHNAIMDKMKLNNPVQSQDAYEPIPGEIQMD